MKLKVKHLVSINLFVLGCSILFFLSGCGTTKVEKVPSANEGTVSPDIESDPFSEDEWVEDEESTYITYVKVKVPETESLLLDDFESGLYFYAALDEKYGHNTDSSNLGEKCALSSEWNTNGYYSIKCVQKKAAYTDKNAHATWYCDSPLETDWTGFKTFAVDIYNGGAVTASVCLQVEATEDNKILQTEYKEIKSGVQTTLLLDIKRFGVKNLADIRRIMLVNKGSAYTYMYFDNLRLYK
ncbi:MAG: hypothetical protein MJ188_05045 [Treponema sp.]|nr:hypothetical protein [Treponema sp.]